MIWIFVILLYLQALSILGNVKNVWYYNKKYDYIVALLYLIVAIFLTIGILWQ